MPFFAKTRLSTSCCLPLFGTSPQCFPLQNARLYLWGCLLFNCSSSHFSKRIKYFARSRINFYIAWPRQALSFLEEWQRSSNTGTSCVVTLQRFRDRLQQTQTRTRRFILVAVAKDFCTKAKITVCAMHMHKTARAVHVLFDDSNDSSTECIFWVEFFREILSAPTWEKMHRTAF